MQNEWLYKCNSEKNTIENTKRDEYKMIPKELQVPTGSDKFIIKKCRCDVCYKCCLSSLPVTEMAKTLYRVQITQVFGLAVAVSFTTHTPSVTYSTGMLLSIVIIIILYMI